MINGYGCYLKYLAIKSHFLNEKYDYFKYGGNIKANINSFNKRSDRYFFEKLAKTLKTDLITEKYFVSNFVHNTNIWIGDTLTEGSSDIFLKWTGKIESIQYSFRRDLIKIKNKAEKNECSIKELFESIEGQHPVVLKMMLKKEIMIETVVFLNYFLNIFEQWDSYIKEKTIWPEVKKRCIKYNPFLFNYLDKSQVKNLKISIKNVIIEEKEE